MATPLNHTRAGTIARCRRIRADLARVKRDVDNLLRGPLAQHVVRLLRDRKVPIWRTGWPTLQILEEVAAKLEQEAATL